jgi:cell division protein FtsZ
MALDDTNFLRTIDEDYNMNDELFTIDEVSEVEEELVKITVIGVGGGGGNMVNHMIKEGTSRINLIAANTDAQALKASLASKKLQLGAKLTRGLGAGMKPEKGFKAAEESFEEIKESLKGSDLVFIATGLGGGTGTGASSVIARAAQEIGALTISICTKPFSFEGPKRMKLANKGYEDLKSECNSMVIIPNDKLLMAIDKNMGYAESFSMVDDVLAKAVTGICSIVLTSGAVGINTDFADLQTVMDHKGLALMGMGFGTGSTGANDAIREAIESPLLEDVSIKGAMGVLVHFQFHSNLSLAAINEAMNIIYDSIDEDADVIFGTTVDDNLGEDEVRTTLVATGFEKEETTSNNVAEKTVEQVERNVRVVRQNLAKAVGDYEFNENEDYLEIPTFLRQQMD